MRLAVMWSHCLLGPRNRCVLKEWVELEGVASAAEDLGTITWLAAEREKLALGRRKLDW
jgi:hypothetical protein